MSPSTGATRGLLGLVWTIWLASRVKSAAEQAREAAIQTNKWISTLDAVAELSSAITILQDIMRLQPTQAWHILGDVVLDRYQALNLHLVRSESAAGLDVNQRSGLRVAIAQFRRIVRILKPLGLLSSVGLLDTPGSTGSPLTR